MNQSPELSILFLCRKYYYLHRMSRVRFHMVRALSQVSRLMWSGPEWENWDNSLSAADNISLLYSSQKPPDLVLGFKTDEIPGFGGIPYPTAVNRDELQTKDYSAEASAAKFTENKIDLVISHQRKQMEHPLFKKLPCRFAYIPGCTDISIFKDYGQEKKIGVLLIGNLAAGRYPLRAKLYQFVLKLRKDPRFQKHQAFVYPFPGYRLKEAYNDAHVIDFAKMINSSKICLTCSGIYRMKYAKYLEVPACRTLLMGDMPCEDQDILREYLAEINPSISYEEFLEKVLFYLENEEERSRLVENGYRIIRDQFTTEHYAEKFAAAVKDYLSRFGHRKLWNA